jgi:hypothetical protein
MAVKRVLQAALPLCCGIIIGALILLLVFLLPTNGIQKNVKDSVKIFQSEGEYPTLYMQDISEQTGLNSRTLDNFTDAIMLSSAAYDGPESLVDKVIYVNRYVFQGYSPVNSLILWDMTGSGQTVRQEGSDQTISLADRSSEAYTRYWHGYLVLLKPLLALFDYGGIRVLNTVVQIGLTLLAIFLMARRKLGRYIFPFCFALLFLMPPSVTQSLQYSSVFYVMLAAVIVMLFRHDRIAAADRYPLVFAVIGVATSYFDFLTYPIATLGVPLTLYFILAEPEDWKQILKSTILLAVYWGIGYAGMWAGKWLLASILTGENAFREALYSIQLRTSSSSDYAVERLSYPAVLKAVYSAFSGTYFTLLCVFAVLERLICAFVVAKKERVRAIKKSDFTRSLRRASAYVLIFLMPFVWYFLAKNHSFEHQWFTYRALSVSVFSLLCAVTLQVKREQKVKQKNSKRVQKDG